jgi:hypothetical protein
MIKKKPACEKRRLNFILICRAVFVRKRDGAVSVKLRCVVAVVYVGFAAVADDCHCYDGEV